MSSPIKHQSKSKLALFLFLSSQSASSFQVNPRHVGGWVARTSSGGTSTLHMSDANKGPLTSEQILANSRKAIGLPEEKEEDLAPINFDDDLVEDMKNSLLTLEQRVKDGPGSLSAEQVADMEVLLTKIYREMVENKDKQAIIPTAGASESPPTNTIDAAVVNPVVPDAPFDDTFAPPREVRTEAPVTQDPVIDTSNDESPAYDGTGGMGMAKGTKSTYVIPGMEEMSPEEYRAALQQSVLDRQSKRKDGRSGMVGNRSAHDYLNQLGYGGASASLAGTENNPGINVAPKSSNSVANLPVPPPAPVYSPAPVPPPAPAVPSSSNPVPFDDTFAPPREVRTEAPVTQDPVIDTSNDESPAYDGTGGMGMAKGTKSTYVIPGMEEMSPEEYRAALQQSVLDRQSKRKDRRSGMVGNRSAHDYLNQLGYGGASASLAGTENNPGINVAPNENA